MENGGDNFKFSSLTGRLSKRTPFSLEEAWRGSYAFFCRFLHVPETANFVAWVTRDPKLLIFDKETLTPTKYTRLELEKMSKAVSHGDQLFVSGPPPLRRQQNPVTGRMEIFREA